VDRNMFGMDDEDEDVDDEDEVVYSIQQLVAADPGWRAVFGCPTDRDSLKVIPLACFALVEITPPDEVGHEADPVHRSIRPMVANEIGIVDDVEGFPDFVCLVPPAMDLHVAMENASRLRKEAEREEATAEA
jgi:hypothetical protein